MSIPIAIFSQSISWKTVGIVTGIGVVLMAITLFTSSRNLDQMIGNITMQKLDRDSFSLTKLEGINLYNRARLLEEGIENIENLAHHNLMELIARTRIPTPRLVDMFDQAILYLHLGLEADEKEENGSKGKDDPRDLLKSLGVRTATDLIRCKDNLNDFKENEKYKTLINKLEVIETALKDDEWLNYVHNWRSYSSSQEIAIDNPFKFHETAIKSQQA